MMNRSTIYIYSILYKFSISAILIIFLLQIPSGLLWDRDNYLIYAEKSDEIIKSYTSISDLIFNDYLFLKLNSFLSNFLQSEQIISFFLFVILSSMFFLISKYSVNTFTFTFTLVLNLLLVPILHFELIAIRQALATILVLFALSYLKNYKVISVIFLIASLIHSAFFLFLLLFWLDNSFFRKFDEKKRIILNFFVIFSIAFSYLIIAKFLGLRQVDLYSSYDAPIGGGTFIICAFIFIYIYKYGSTQYNFLYYYTLQGLILFLVFYFVANASVSARLLESVLPAFLLLFANKFRNKEVLIGSLVAIAYLYVWYNGGVYILFEVSNIQAKQFLLSYL